MNFNTVKRAIEALREMQVIEKLYISKIIKTPSLFKG